MWVIITTAASGPCLSPQKPIWRIIVAKPCNYNVMWCTHPQKDFLCVCHNPCKMTPFIIIILSNLFEFPSWHFRQLRRATWLNNSIPIQVSRLLAWLLCACSMGSKLLNWCGRVGEFYTQKVNLLASYANMHMPPGRSIHFPVDVRDFVQPFLTPHASNTVAWSVDKCFKLPHVAVGTNLVSFLMVPLELKA